MGRQIGSPISRGKITPIRLRPIVFAPHADGHRHMQHQRCHGRSARQCSLTARNHRPVRNGSSAAGQILLNYFQSLTRIIVSVPVRTALYPATSFTDCRSCGLGSVLHHRTIAVGNKWPCARRNPAGAFKWRTARLRADGVRTLKSRTGANNKNHSQDWNRKYRQSQPSEAPAAHNWFCLRSARIYQRQNHRAHDDEG